MPRSMRCYACHFFVTLREVRGMRAMMQTLTAEGNSGLLIDAISLGYCSCQQ